MLYPMQEPNKFELQDGDHKSTEHWKPTLKDERKVRRKSSTDGGDDIKLPSVVTEQSMTTSTDM